jgi:hypothetical protein
MLLKLNKEDNQKFFDVFDSHNKSVERISDKIALDVYVEALDFVENDIVFHCVKLDKSEIKVFGAEEENIGSGSDKKPGERLIVKFSNLEPEIKSLSLSFVREIKISKMID